MEGWKIVLRDYVTGIGKYYGTKGYAVSMDTNQGDIVLNAIYEGINTEYPLSTDFIRADKSSADPNKIIIRVGSKQAEDELIDRFVTFSREVDNWRATGFANNEEKLQAELEAKIAELEAKDAEMKQQSDTDTWGIVMVLCVAAALIILLTDK